MDARGYSVDNWVFIALIPQHDTARTRGLGPERSDAC
jgi:hypothetical protein